MNTLDSYQQAGRWIKHSVVFLLLIASSGVLLRAQPNLVWSDEFAVDGLPDAAKWLYDTGGGGWGNDEEQFYTDGRLENARVENGVLIIEARKEGWPAGRNPEYEYTSARLLSKGSGDWLYGRIEARAKIPAGRGTWPAIWMLPTGTEYGTWPRSGEIDIMEHVGFEMGTVHGSLHSFANNWLTETQPTGSIFIEDVDTAFHTYAVEWSPGSIRFLVDDVEYYSFSDPGTGWEAWPFNQPFHIILNLAVGGFWGGEKGIDPDIWPARMEVDYVRVYDLGDSVPLDTDGDLDPNATDPDDDDDGLTDIEEHGFGTNILKADSDGDGFTDAEEIAAGTFPLLKGSFPGSDQSILMINNDFEFGEEPWIVHTNKLDADFEWIGQAESWGGTYAVFDYVTPGIDGLAVFSNYQELDAVNAEHLLYQEWTATEEFLITGDMVRFRGVAHGTSSDEAMTIRVFIRVLDAGFMPMNGTVDLDLGTEATPFELETTLPGESFKAVQTGFLIMGSTSGIATVTFSGLEATLNESTSWAGWPIVSGNVDTGAWMGWIYIANDPWVWNYNLANWIYLPEAFVTESGGWVFIPSTP